MRNPIAPLFIIGLVFIAAFAASLHPQIPIKQTDTAKNVAAGAQGTVTATVATAAQAPSTPTPTLEATATDAPTAEPTVTRQPVPPVLQAQIDKIEAQASYLRGLQPLDDVPENFITRAQFHEQYKREMQASYSVDEVKQYILQLWLLRLVKDPSIDFYEASADLGSDGILGYYDPLKKNLFVITDKLKLKLEPEAQVTLAHEYVHSLQDQHYKLTKIWPIGTTDQDRVMAIKSLVEGDATLSGYVWAANYMSGHDFRSLFEQKTLSKDVKVKTPPYLGISTIFPYTAGPEFVAKLLQVGGFSTVNLALQDPPRSTEQIMHPEKFLQTPIDQPKQVDLPELASMLGAGWEKKGGNTLGEFDLNIMLRENGASDPDRGADGWGGGKYALYEKDASAMAYSIVTWDTENDAKEFEGAMGETFAKTPKDGQFWTDAGRYFWMARSTKSVTFIASTDKAALEKAMAVK